MYNLVFEKDYKEQKRIQVEDFGSLGYYIQEMLKDGFIYIGYENVEEV